MNWASYLVNQLEKDFREAQDHGYEFHFSWLLILVIFISWEMPEGATIPKIEPFEPLAMNFTTLWYSRNMAKQWQSNVMLHTYYLQLKRVIESFPCMASNTLHRFRPFVKFRTYNHFIYITACRHEHKEEIQSYYNITKEDMKEINKEWPIEFLIPIDQVELSDLNLIDSPVVTRMKSMMHPVVVEGRRRKRYRN
jgi:hypothetical protein